MQAFRSKMVLVEHWMSDMGLQPKLRRKIKTYYAEVRAQGLGGAHSACLHKPYVRWECRIYLLFLGSRV